MPSWRKESDVFDFPTPEEEEAEAERVEAKRVKRIGEEVRS